MRAIRWLGPALIVLGIAALVIGFLRNEATLSLFLIFPVVTATGAWSGLGILSLLAGFVSFFLTWPMWLPGREGPHAPMPTDVTPQPVTAPPAAAASRRWGGVVFLGPIPVVFGSDAKVTRWMLVAGFVLFLALVVLTIIALWGI